MWAGTGNIFSLVPLLAWRWVPVLLQLKVDGTGIDAYSVTIEGGASTCSVMVEGW